MAAASDPTRVSTGMPPPRGPVTVAVHPAHSPGLRIHLYIDVLAGSLLVFLTSTTAEAAPSGTSMGSLVYAIPDRYNPSQPMSTVLYHLPSTVDFATRVAKALTRRLGKPCYVGSSINLSASAGGGGMDEEVEAFRTILAVILRESGGAEGLR